MLSFEKKTGRVLIAFRTHYWNDDLYYLAKKLYGESVNYDFYVVADETKNILNVGPFKKISHTSDMKHLQLPSWPKNYNNLHYNGDYVFYEIRRQKPDYDFYFLVENDAIINFDLDSLFENVFEDEIDIVAKIDEINSPLHAEFHQNVKRYFNNTGRAFFPVIGLSSNIIDGLYKKRLDIKIKDDAEENWPYCESFLASFALSEANCNILNLDDFYDTNDFTFMKHKYIYDPKVHRYMSVCHPVVGKEFMEKNLLVADVTSIFDKQSDLYTGINALFKMNNLSFLDFLEKKIKEKKSLKLLTEFWNFSFSEGWIKHLPAINYAFAKPAVQSSVGQYSSFNDPKLDASLVVDGFIVGGTKSHTSFEKNPWLLIDLEKIIEIRSVVIYVRPENFHIFNDFYISFSNDFNQWDIEYRKTDGIPFNSKDLKPIVISFQPGKFYRGVKITLDHEEALFLNQVEIYSY